MTSFVRVLLGADIRRPAQAQTYVLPSQLLNCGHTRPLSGRLAARRSGRVAASGALGLVAAVYDSKLPAQIRRSAA